MQEIKYILKFSNINFSNLAYLLNIDSSCLVMYLNNPDIIPAEINKKINILVDMLQPI